MTNEDQKMLESALWHISNSVTNGKSQTAECEITQWLKNKINSIPDEKPSEDSNDPKNDSDHSETLYTYEQINILANNRAQWQKEQTINKACKWLNENIVEYRPRTGKLRPIVNINAFREAMEDKQ